MAILLIAMKHVCTLVISLCFAVSFCAAQDQDRRLSPVLKIALTNKDTSDVTVVVLAQSLYKLHKQDAIAFLHEYPSSNTAVVRLKASHLKKLLNSGDILFADQYRKPKEELTTGTLDLSLNKINYAHNQFPLINGDSVVASVKEQRFDTTDIDIKGRYINSHVTAPTQATHASVMVTMLGGGGNTSPYAKGAGWGSTVTSSDFANLMPDGDSVYQKYMISVQNHSYGTGIENYYGADAVAFDVSTKTNPGLLHVFSSGNQGNSVSTSGAYTGIQGFATLTGSFKMAKNVIIVGATDSFNHVVAPSSKGPAYDGRVKPDLVAYGEDGSSGAAALVSGSAVLVQHAYKRIYDNHLPSNTLVKAVLLNSADDVERPGIDYASGYGALDNYGAIKTVLEKRFYEDSIGQGEVKRFAISVPPNAAGVKCTLVWMDVPAVANAPKALVNDLDAQVQLPVTSEVWLPWILNPAAHKDSLLLPAQRGIDTVNTVEQITISSPQAGNYVVQVIGRKVQPGSRQSFSVAFQVDTVNHFVWTYPTSSDPLAAGVSNTVRWETSIDDTATIEYSTTGLQWQVLAHGVPVKNQYYQWVTPDTTTIALLRLKTAAPALSFVSDSFTLSEVLSLRVGFNCSDSFQLHWNHLPVSQYQLYELGERYLQPFRTTTDSVAILSKRQSPSLHYAVASLIHSKPALRSFTTNYTTQGVGCYISSFLATLQTASALLTVQLGSTYNINSIVVLKQSSSGVTVVQTINPPLPTSFKVTDPNLVRGVNTYQLAIKLLNGSTIYSNTEVVYYFPDLPVIIYPNPARQNEPIRMIAREPGVYSITVYDAIGRTVVKQALEDIYQEVPPLRLSKGLYFIKVVSQDGKVFVQKLVVG